MSMFKELSVCLWPIRIVHARLAKLVFVSWGSHDNCWQQFCVKMIEKRNPPENMTETLRSFRDRLLQVNTHWMVKGSSELGEGGFE